jgi:hypothetical protein
LLNNGQSRIFQTQDDMTRMKLKNVEVYRKMVKARDNFEHSLLGGIPNQGMKQKQLKLVDLDFVKSSKDHIYPLTSHSNVRRSCNEGHSRQALTPVAFKSNPFLLDRYLLSRESVS